MELLWMFFEGCAKAVGWVLAKVIFALVELVKLLLRLFRCLFTVDCKIDAKTQSERDAEYDRRESAGARVFFNVISTVPGLLLFFFAAYKIIEGIQGNLVLAISVSIIAVLSIIALAIVKANDLINPHPYITRFVVVIIMVLCIVVSSKIIDSIRVNEKIKTSDYNEQARDMTDYSESFEVNNIYSVNQDGLNLRKGPGVSYDVITILSYGTKITVLDDSLSDWWKIEENTCGYVGFVNKKYLSK